MNAIIVGLNGRPSILDLLFTYHFKNDVTVFSNFVNKSNNKIFWKSYTGKEKSKVIDEPVFHKGDKIIRWGDRIQLSTNGAIVYNTNEALNNASNKKLSREIMEKAGVSVPILIPDNEMYKSNYPVVVRPARHHAGNEFYVVNNDNDLINITRRLGSGNYYISQVYPKTEEYRIHCACGKVLLLKRKPEPDNKNEIAWNFAINEKPWTTIERREYSPTMVKLALDAVKSLGLDFGAVDIMSKPTDKTLPTHVVLEVNTAPSFTPYLIEKYGLLFDKIFSSPTKIEHWDYTKFSQGKSLSWKNKQLKN
jgi:glutathione synthase/RimK-type ligase-like ATP-grasp enzyme